MGLGTRRKMLVCVAIALIVFVAMPASGMAGAKHATTKKSGAAAGARSVTPQKVFFADMYEADDGTATAKVLPEMSFHTIHSDTDQDWFKITAEATDTPFSLEMQMWEGQEDWDTYMAVYRLNPDGTVSILDSNDDHDYFDTYSSMIYFEAPAPGTYYVMCRGLSTGYQGSYWLRQAKGIGVRVGGADRYDTAVAVSRFMFSNNNIPSYSNEDPEYVVVANGTSAADALAGSVLASVDDGVLLLTTPNALPAQTKAEISRVFTAPYWNGMEPTVYVLGGPAAVSDAVVAEIESINEVQEVVRLSGADRYATAAEIAYQVDDDYGADSTAFIVNGMSWADALAAGPVAAWYGSPILLTGMDSLPASTTAAIGDLGITHAIIVGSESVVSADVADDLASILGTVTAVSRIGGTNRYETARLLAQYGVDTRNMDGDRMTLVSGENFPDGLAAAPISWWRSDGPLLLTPKMSLSPEVRTFVEDNGPMGDNSYLIGGTGAVSDATYNAWKALYNLPD